MDTIQNILTRKSIRSYDDKPISKEDLHTILTAGMSGPSCVNARDWQFLVIEDREMLNKIADCNGRPAEPLRGAAAGIILCGDLNRAFPRAKDYCVIDTSIACQNMILAARALGIGSVWLGTWPQMERVEKLAKLLDLPEHIVPHSVLALGHSSETADMTGKNAYDESVVHWEKW